MTTYSVLKRERQPGFKVEVQAADGTRGTMLGFNTEEEAHAWVAQSRRLDALRSKQLPD